MTAFLEVGVSLAVARLDLEPTELKIDTLICRDLILQIWTLIFQIVLKTFLETTPYHNVVH